jgi:hypothetical protein
VDALFEAASAAPLCGADGADARALGALAAALVCAPGGAAADAAVHWREARVHYGALQRCVARGDGRGAAAARERGIAAADLARLRAPECLPAHALAAQLKLSAFPAVGVLPLPELQLLDTAKAWTEFLLDAAACVKKLRECAPDAPATHFIAGTLAAAVAQLLWAQKERYRVSANPAPAVFTDGDAAVAFDRCAALLGGALPLCVAVRRAYALSRRGAPQRDAEAALEEWVRRHKDAAAAGGGGGRAEDALRLPACDWQSRAEAVTIARCDWQSRAEAVTIARSFSFSAEKLAELEAALEWTLPLAGPQAASKKD